MNLNFSESRTSKKEDPLCGMSDYERGELIRFTEVIRRSLDEVMRSEVVKDRSGHVTINLEINYAVGGGAKVVMGHDYNKED